MTVPTAKIGHNFKPTTSNRIGTAASKGANGALTDRSGARSARPGGGAASARNTSTSSAAKHKFSGT